MLHLTINYRGGIKPRYDRQLTELVEAQAGERTGSGCFLIGDMPRDLSFVIPDTADRPMILREAAAICGADFINVAYDTWEDEDR